MRERIKMCVCVCVCARAHVCLFVCLFVCMRACVRVWWSSWWRWWWGECVLCQILFPVLRFWLRLRLLASWLRRAVVISFGFQTWCFDFATRSLLVQRDANEVPRVGVGAPALATRVRRVLAVWWARHAGRGHTACERGVDIWSDAANDHSVAACGRSRVSGTTGAVACRRSVSAARCCSIYERGVWVHSGGGSGE
jgi:hypothetical protein